MSIDISSKLMLVPCNMNKFRSKIEDICQNEDCNEDDVIEDFGLEYCSPWYDTNFNNWIIGVEVDPPSYEDLIDSESTWFNDLHKAQRKLCEIMCEQLLETELISVQNVY